jgi:predicted CoA-binding protein
MGDTPDPDLELRQILLETRSIAVVGIKAKPSEDAFRVPQYLQQQGYRIVPVSPKLESVLDEPAVTGLDQAPAPIDLMNLFRASDHIPGHADEILAMSPRPRAVWMQLGIRHEAAAARLRAAGIQVVQDRCIMVDHQRLLATP